MVLLSFPRSSVTAIKLRYCRACYPLSPTPPPEGGGAFLPSPLQGRAKRGGRSRPGERVFWLNLMAVTLLGPAGQAQHGDATRHRQHGLNDDSELVQGPPIQVWTQSA